MKREERKKRCGAALGIVHTKQNYTTDKQYTSFR